MRKITQRKGAIPFLVVGAILLASAGVFSLANAKMQASTDGEVITRTTDQWDEPDYELPTVEAGEGVYDSYQGPITVGLMPIDLSLTKADIPFLAEKFSASNYLAIYFDHKISLRITKDAVIQVSNDNGITWETCDVDTIPMENFTLWLLEHDILPGYSMKEMQLRLEGGAEVTHLVFEDGVKEMYFIIDSSGAQIELVQAEKIASVLVDGKRMMITTTQIPYTISDDMLESFYDLLISNDVLNKFEVEQVRAEVLPWVESAR